jgi:hypothetical protein
VISVVLLPAALLWNASQLWKVREGAVRDYMSPLNAAGLLATGGVGDGVHFTVASLNAGSGFDTSGADNIACVQHLLMDLQRQDANNQSASSSAEITHYEGEYDKDWQYINGE